MVNRVVNLTAEQVARVFHAKRTGPRRWRAACPLHGGRFSGPLSIAEGTKGVIVQCFGGCSAEAVLASAGLRFSDLFAASKLDP